MPKAIGLQSFRRNLSRVLGEVTYAGETYIIESYGRPAAVLVSQDEYQRLTRHSRKAAAARIWSPRLVNPAQARDFELEVEVEATADA